MDSYFDPNERKYFITPQSVEAAITEEKARAASKTTSQQDPLEAIRIVPIAAERESHEKKSAAATEIEHTRELEREILDLRIANRGKDFLIEQMQMERTGFFKDLLVANRKMGELETKLLQLGKPPYQEGAMA